MSRKSIHYYPDEIVSVEMCHPFNNSLNLIFSELSSWLFPLYSIPILFYVLHWLKIHHISKIWILWLSLDHGQVQSAAHTFTSKVQVWLIYIIQTK
jgi:dTDP-glucose pyrophosphorylase